MKKETSGREAATIRAWAGKDDTKVTIQIEDRDGETLAYIELSPDKASDLSDHLAVYAAKLKISARNRRALRNVSSRPALLC